MTIPLFGAAIVPSLLLLWYFRARDLNPEPRAVILGTFWLGVATTIPAAIGEHLETQIVHAAHLGPLATSVNDAFLSAALFEEALKFAVLWGYASRHKAFDEPMDGVVYGATASLGFATLENILYVAQHGLGVAVLRAVLSVPGHAAWGALMGYHVGQARFGDPADRGRHLALALALPIGLHGLYDFAIMYHTALKDTGTPWLLAVPIVVVALSWRLVVGQVRRLRADQERAGQVAAQADGGEARPRSLVRPLWAWVQILLGGAAASWGGLVTIGVAIGVAVDSVKQDNMTALALGTALIGVIPLAVGVALFARGLRSRAASAGQVAPA